jgi:hypothetical protein
MKALKSTARNDDPAVGDVVVGAAKRVWSIRLFDIGESLQTALWFGVALFCYCADFTAMEREVIILNHDPTIQAAPRTPGWLGTVAGLFVTTTLAAVYLKSNPSYRNRMKTLILATSISPFLFFIAADLPAPALVRYVGGAIAAAGVFSAIMLRGFRAT